MSSENGSPFSRVIQIGIVVRDAQATVDRLEALGIGPFESKELPADRQEWFRGKPMDAEFDIRAARIGDIEIELVQPVSGDSPHREFLEMKGEGIQHFACAVEDIQSAVDKLNSQGVETLLRAKFPGGRGAAYMELGTAGIVIELIQRKAELW